jgi:NAD(P)-dependent dehydrogenase (short-subunit alcohol dehydrogenase family)
MDLTGRKFLVTGAGTGIGRGVALALAGMGADVGLHYLHEPEGAQSAAEEIRALGRSAVTVQGDLSNVDEALALPATIAAGLGGLDGVVNNAGITMNRSFLDTTPGQFDTLFNVNVRAMYFVTQAAARLMIPRGGGTVVNVSSVHAYGAIVEHSVYAATKAAIVGFTRTLSVELIQVGIRVNCVAPGWVLTENQRTALKLDDSFDEIAAAQVMPAGFIGTGSDIGNLVAFLSTDDSRYIIGQTINCDGGQSALMPATGNFREPTTVRYGQGYVPGI